MNLENLTQKFNVDVKANRINKYDQQWYVVGEKQEDRPSVTTILDVFPKGMGFKLWLQRVGENADIIRDEAGQLGQHTHKMIELTLRGEIVSFENEDGSRNCTLEEWERYLSWCLWYQEAKEKDGFEPLLIEQIVFDEMTAGTIDCIAKTKRGLRIKDWKTGSFVGDTAEIQVSKYVQMANKMGVFGKIEGADIVQLNPSLNKKGFREKEVEEVDLNLLTFDNCYSLWKRVNKNAAPKYKIYPNAVNLEFLETHKLNFNNQEDK